MTELIIMSLIAGLSTSIGAIIVVTIGHISHLSEDIMFGFAAGTLIGIVTFGLIPESLTSGNFTIFLAGFLLGAVILTLVDSYIPKIRSNLGKTSNVFKSPLAILMLLLITSNNIFEGIAVGSAFSAEKTGLGLLVILGIIAHNIPEGLILSLPLRDAGISKFKNVLYTTLTGLMEPLFAILTFTFLVFLADLVPFVLAFASGTIVYVSFKELIPRAHAHCHPFFSSWGMILGFITIILAETILL
ncbi:MAG: hypothetical protein A2287_01080 [Candidatus Melainabacteria bacterium RIFOXYA12_FULL_32_12]|nr:MAG: hypothetical protein A2287_01080 [Candidatus Melainabacteria bacterium RIFOXYA12_FULL_32_12]